MCGTNQLRDRAEAGPREEVTAVVQVGGDGGSDHGDCGGGEVIDSGCVLKVEQPGSAGQ